MACDSGLHKSLRAVGAGALVVLLAACSSGGASISNTTSTTATTTTAPAASSMPTSTTAVVTTPTTFDRSGSTPWERCMERAVFDDPVESPYILPYPAGTGFTVLQSYCNDDGSHETQLAYDFTMPLGSDVVAARAGFVSSVRSDVSDTANTSDFNHVTVRHDDGTVASYAHLMEAGVLVAVGDTVGQGELIAYSGSSGRAGEVLHFGVYATDPPREGTDRAVNFSNAEGALDGRGGLRQGTFYRALPWWRR